MNRLVKADTTIFHFINHSCHCKVLDKIMPSITSLGNTAPVLVIAILLMLLSRIPYYKVLIAGMITMVTTQTIKILVKRLRPHIVMQTSPIMQKLMFYDPSLPSAHTAITSCLGAVLSFYYPMMLPFAIITSILVGFSRVYLGQHYPLDVLIGAAIGWAAGLLVCAL